MEGFITSNNGIKNEYAEYCKIHIDTSNDKEKKILQTIIFYLFDSLIIEYMNDIYNLNIKPSDCVISIRKESSQNATYTLFLKAQDISLSYRNIDINHLDMLLLI